MDKNIEISENFWKEFKLRGFDYKNDTGGKLMPNYKNGVIKGYGNRFYKLFFSNVNSPITVIDPKLFFKTVKKIETIVKYKLFY